MDAESIRAAWKTGSRCEIFSASTKQWFLGEIVRTFTDEQGEWLEVRYGQSTANQKKQVHRDSDVIRPLVECCMYIGSDWVTVDTVALSRHMQPQMDQDAYIRAGWHAGSCCEVFSYTANQWLSGQVLRVFDDDEGEWLNVKFNETTVKDLDRYSHDIRPHVE